MQKEIKLKANESQVFDVNKRSKIKILSDGNSNLKIELFNELDLSLFSDEYNKSNTNSNIKEEGKYKIFYHYPNAPMIKVFKTNPVFNHRDYTKFELLSTNDITVWLID
jgi:hypothetical protein